MSAIKTLLIAAAALLTFAGATNAGQLASGTLLNVPGDTALYFVINGYAAHVPSPKVSQCLQLPGHEVVKVTKAQLDAMPKTPFLVEGGDGKIYRVDGERKRLVPNMDVFNRLGFKNEQVMHLPAAMVNCIPDGTPLH
jgi:hypothetical protein